MVRGVGVEREWVRMSFTIALRCFCSIMATVLYSHLLSGTVILFSDRLRLNEFKQYLVIVQKNCGALLFYFTSTAIRTRFERVN